MAGKRPSKHFFFILIVKRFNKRTYHIYYLGIPPTHSLSFAYFFQIFVLLFYVVHFNKLLRFFFWGFHTVYHNVLSDYVSFHSMYIEGTLHLYFFIGGNSGAFNDTVVMVIHNINVSSQKI